MRRFTLVFVGCLLSFSVSLIVYQPSDAQSENRKVVVFLVEGNQDCCIHGAETLINGLKRIRQPGIEVIFAGLDARNLRSSYYTDYTIPWNSVYNRGEDVRAVDNNINSGTQHFVDDVQQYIGTLPNDTAFIFIGHSFGGDSILTYLQQDQRSRNILFVGVIDPVDGGGIRSTLKSKRIPGTIQYFFNRWQSNNSLSCVQTGHPSDCGWPVDFSISGSISCSAQHCDQKEQSASRNMDGTARRVTCGALEIGCSGAGFNMELQCDPFGIVCTDVLVYDPGTKNKITSHQKLASDAFVQKQMVDIIIGLVQEYAAGDNDSSFDSTQIHVNHSNAGRETGSDVYPYNTIVEALSTVDDLGTIYIHAGNYPEPLMINRPMTLRGINGVVNIGGVQP